MASLNTTSKYRLLAVDDDKDSAELIVRNALRCGYECFPVYDARTLREIIRTGALTSSRSISAFPMPNGSRPFRRSRPCNSPAI